MNTIRRLARCWAGLVLAVLTAHGAPGLATEVRWIYPPPNSLITRSPVSLLGYVLGPPESFLDARVVSADGASPPRREPLYLFKGKVFSGFLALEPGRNNLVVGDSVLSLLYRPDSEADREGGFRRPYAHGGGIESCNPCHRFARGEITLNAPPAELCSSCHRLGTESLRAVLRQNEHTRTITPDCLRCHEPHASFQRALLREGDLCAACHRPLADPSRHEATAPHCTACHDPHASAYPEMLKAEAPAICRSCHKEVASPERYPRSYHRPVEEGRCFDCHGSHPAGSPDLLTAGVPDLCRKCHAPKDEGPHAGRLSDCLSCHRSHLSDRQGLLKEAVSDVCLGCHGTPPEGVSNHPALKEGCVTCHDPHAPEALVDSEKVCGRCHGLRDDGFRYTHGQLDMRGVRQCTFCHEPHSSSYPKLLRGVVHYPLKNGGCNACHEEKQGRIALRYEGSKNCTRCHGRITGTSAIIETDKVHKPVYQVDCIACHNPHLGVRGSFLLEEPEVLCGWCHGLILRGVEHVHGALREKGTCYTCHLPHISDFRPLLKRPERELCTRCHSAVLPKEPGRSRGLHGALTAGRCTGCHNPHGTNTEKLLRGTRDDLCRSCHPAAVRDGKGASFRFVHGPVGAGNCTACHELRHQHARVGDEFLRAEGRAVCTLCHDTREGHVPDRYRPKMREVRNDCLACHVPHGADNQFMMRSGF